ncbi:hypothetical protein K501DRAFT_273910 [Backusella circina FSU 941]|nr:hypothetical protein K501DRAFT_273910 [Backusella circina FSU 941]
MLLLYKKYYRRSIKLVGLLLKSTFTIKNEKDSFNYGGIQSSMNWGYLFNDIKRNVCILIFIIIMFAIKRKIDDIPDLHVADNGDNVPEYNIKRNKRDKGYERMMELIENERHYADIKKREAMKLRKRPSSQPLQYWLLTNLLPLAPATSKPIPPPPSLPSYFTLIESGQVYEVFQQLSEYIYVIKRVL